MVKNKDDYQVTIATAQSRLSATDRLLSKLLHTHAINLVLHALERSLFRIVPMQIALVATVTVGLLIVCVAYFYGYHIASLNVLGGVFILGFIVGAVYEYVRALIRQVK